MGKYTVEVEGEVSESVWGVYEVEAEDEDEARSIGIDEFYGENWGVEVVTTYVEAEN